MRIKKVVVENPQSLYHMYKRKIKSNCVNAMWKSFMCYYSFNMNIMFIRVWVVHTFNHSTQEAEGGGSLRIGSQPSLQSEL